MEDEQARVCAVHKWFKEMEKREKKKKKKHKYEDNDHDEDDDEMYHPSEDYNDDSWFDPEYRPTRRELKEADEEGDSSVKGQVKLSGCKYVNMLPLYICSVYDKTFRKPILYPRALCFIIYS